jgi:hypothetical protein
MKNISKLLVGILFSALVTSTSFAGELAVTGGATATYATNGDDASAGKNIGISNEIDLTASGELDNGYTWKYQVQLDTASAVNDDTRLEIGTDMGTIGIYVSEGGLSKELMTGAGALGVGFDYISPTSFNAGYDVDGYSNIQYHLPADLLPFGLGLKVGYVPNMSATTMLSAKESDTTLASEALGRKLMMAQVTAAPIDGLSIGGDVAVTDDQTGSSGNNGTEEGVSANVGASYTMGQVTVGYTEGAQQTAVASGEITYYENKFMGIQFDVNDALSVSYNVDESTANVRAAVIPTATAGTKTVTAMEQKSIQLAYTTGGATIGIAQVEVDNSDYVAGKSETQSVVSLGISF